MYGYVGEVNKVDIIDMVKSITDTKPNRDGCRYLEKQMTLDPIKIMIS